MSSGLPELFCREVLGCEAGKIERMPAIDHGFTHFRLKARPVLCRVRRILPRAEAPGRIWLDIEDAPRAAVPVPVRQLLLGLRKQG